MMLRNLARRSTLVVRNLNKPGNGLASSRFAAGKLSSSVLGSTSSTLYTPSSSSLSSQCSWSSSLVHQQRRTLYTTEERKNQIENANLLRYIEAWRTYGHLLATTNPLEDPATKQLPAALELSLYGLDSVAQDKKFPLAGLLNVPGTQSATFEETQSHLRRIYSGNIGVEFSHVSNVEEKEWLTKHIEESLSSKSASTEEKKEIHRLMFESELFDRFMQTKFGSVKRYALEGCESMMPAMNALFNSAAQSGITNVVLGMPHRGRLNLLTGLLKMSPTVIFAKAKGISELPPGSYATGDVLSHLAISSQLDNGVNVSLLHNPSHLEAINPVVMGKARSKQTLLGDSKREKVLGVQLHGDAAFIGQGISTETLELANLPGFTTGGSFHLIVNNQLGFTTDPRDGRTSRYSSDIGKAIETPVFHVNADAPEDVVKTIRLALAYRNQFKKDVIVDLIGYRRHGHNELDEPAFTQPKMYSNIRSRKTVVDTYTQRLVEEGVVTSEELNQLKNEIQTKFEGHFQELPTWKAPSTHLQGRWSTLTDPTDMREAVETGVELSLLQHIGRKSVEVGSTAIHSRLDKMFSAVRLVKIESKKDIDWATAESLAFGSLLAEGHNVRISGQDVGRGTFSHRHIVFVDQQSAKRFIPLNNLGLQGKQGRIESVNSNLSEFAVTAYEYGYSIDDPFTLAIWEAQFGDFANGAQITIDQFISSSETKWLRQTGMVLLLPHGYDGAGPEHSSCRIERFLQLVDGDAIHPEQRGWDKNINLQVINPSTPANYFHALRRQQLRTYRKPLVVVAPKTLLRHPSALSTLEEMGSSTKFQSVLGDKEVDPNKVTKLAFISGKIYYDLIKERQTRKADNIAFIRLEELAPFPYEALRAEIAKYPNAKSFSWVQEEHQNMGAWFFVQPRFNHVISSPLKYVGRGPCAASAVGNSKVHAAENAAIYAETFA